MSWNRRSTKRRWEVFEGYPPYVPVAVRKANAAKYAEKLAKKEGRELAPVKIAGRAIAGTYWGKAWCDHLESFSDFASRLPRGRTYARNGSVIDLQIKKGKIEAIVSGSEIYTISIAIETLAKGLWSRLKAECSRSIASLIDLLQGRFDQGVMQRLAHPTEGLFPRPKEIKFKCSCPDWAGLCKHLAAVLYGVGNRLDASPELLFTLRNVDHLELVSQAVAEGNLDRTLHAGTADSLVGGDLGAIFGIDLDGGEAAPKKPRRARRSAAVPPAIEVAPPEAAAAPRISRRKAVAKSKSSAVGRKRTKTAKRLKAR